MPVALRSLCCGAALAGLVGTLSAQPASAPRAVDAVDTMPLQRHLRALTADSMEGRGGGYPGEARAAAYIAGRFAAAGLRPMGDDGGYLQRVPLPARRPTTPFAVLPSHNVVALLPGRDPALRDEIVVIGAHYDGQGRQGQADMGRRIPDGGATDAIYHGANDNGAAAAALVAIAEAMAADPPARSLLFVAFGAEEHGLVGSLHYAANPARPWAQHVAMLNLEMIGWDGDTDLNARATATSRDWPALLDSATALTGQRTLRITPALTNDTDHYGFGVRGLPVLHFGVPGSREHYHATTDTEERIAYPALARRAQYAATVARLVADRPTRLSADWVHPPDLGLTYVALTTGEYAALGLPDGTGALKVNAVAAGLPAAAAGVRAGDVISAVNGSGWGRNQPGANVLRAATTAAADTGRVTLTLWREGQRRELTVPMRAAGTGTQLVMLGTGTPNADPDRSGPALAVVRGGDAYLVDAGPGVLRRAAAAQRDGVAALAPSNLRTLFLTHLHHDHTLGLGELLLGAWTLERTVPLRIYGPEGTKRMVELLLQAYEPDIRNRIDGAEPANTTGWRADVVEIAPGEVYRDSNVVVTAIAVPHGDWAEAYGYKFTSPERTIVVSGDTRPSDALVEACGGCDLLVHEVMSAERLATRPPAWQAYHRGAHTSTAQLADIATRARPRQLLLYHQLYWGTDDDGLIAELRRAGYTGRVTAARDLGRY
jgi:ribonuclease BN (tRNA processing enzyme)/acetylornithine deacetylase/succinyl-diaminopimelate desuccinylase-like protein